MKIKSLRKSFGKLSRRIMALAISAVMACGVLTPTAVFAAPDTQTEDEVIRAEDVIETTDSDDADDAARQFDAIETADINLGKSALIPLSGYYTKDIDVNEDGEFEENRSVKLFFSDYTNCRAYFTIIAVPDGVDTRDFLEKQGWLDLVNSRGEALVALEPGEGGWGAAADEQAYVDAAMSFVNSGRNAKNVMLFTNYSTFYFVGYGKGAAALETWSAKNPTYVDSQAFIGGESAGKDFLDEAGARIYDGTNTGGYDPGIAELDEFKAVLKTLGYEDVISRKDVPVPTWFDNYAADDYSIEYWKNANDVAAAADEKGFFRQDINSDAFQTEYDNSWRARLGETTGLSAVRVTTANGTPSARELGEFLYGYSRYNIPFAYSNHLSERQDYTEARVKAQKLAARKAIDESTYIAYEKPYTAVSGKVYEGYNLLAEATSAGKNGTFTSGIFATADDNNDGVLDAREYLMYIPKSVSGKTPVVFQFPGMTQSVAVGFDSTQWWRIADMYGVIVIILGEVYNNGVALSWKNSDTEYMAMMDILAKEVDGVEAEIDWTRIYGSGHSLGSAQVQTYVHTRPDFFAAVASTSFGSQTEEGDHDMVPAYLAVGQSDLPFLMKDLWTSDSLKTWFGYLAAANDLKVAEATPENADKADTEGRFKTYTWNNKQDIPMVAWTQTYLREHNCYPKEVEFAWEFLSRYSKDETGRYYSASAFTAEDAVKLEKQGSEADPAAIEGFVKQLYKDFLGRDADEKGLADWVNVLTSGTAALSDVVVGFVNSEEFQQKPLEDEAYVTALYRIIFSREPDENGLKAWVGVLENGATRDKVLGGFVNSDEFSKLAEGLGVKAGSYNPPKDILDINHGLTSFVARLYYTCLGRKYDLKGLRDWVEVILDGTAGADRVARNFLMSKEMENKNLSDDDFLKVCYVALFNREPDARGFANWQDAIAKGLDRDGLISGFTGSREFGNLCKSFGIE